MLALAAAAVALVLTASLKQDAATKDDLDALRDQLSGVEQSATQAAQTASSPLNQRLTDLESEVDKLSADQTTSKRELQVVQDDIKELRSQVSSGGSAATGTRDGHRARRPGSRHRHRGGTGPGAGGDPRAPAAEPAPSARDDL